MGVIAYPVIYGLLTLGIELDRADVGVVIIGENVDIIRKEPVPGVILAHPEGIRDLKFVFLEVSGIELRELEEFFIGGTVQEGIDDLLICLTLGCLLDHGHCQEC